MKLDYRHLAFALIVAGGLSGCQGLWNDLFGGGGSSAQKPLGIQPGEVVVCDPQRDPNLPSLLANNVPCSADSQCPVGSFCTGNGVSGTCIRECGPDLPNCTGNRYCSCQGVCEEIGTPGRDAGAGGTLLVCARNQELLDGLKGDGGAARRCETDMTCPLGAYCSQETGYCTWDCMTDSDCAPGGGGICDCYGQCVGADGGIPLNRREFTMRLSPISISVVPLGDGAGGGVDGGTEPNWERTIDVIVATRDQGLLPGSGTIEPRTYPGTLNVSVRPSEGILVACANIGVPEFSASGCNLANTTSENWLFRWDGEQWVAAKRLLIRRPTGSEQHGATGAGEWTVRFHSDATTPNTLVGTLRSKAAKPEAEWRSVPSPQLGDPLPGYKGTVHISSPLALGAAPASASPAAFDIDVTATGLSACLPKTGADKCMTLYDSASLTLGFPIVAIPFVKESGEGEPESWIGSAFVSFGGRADAQAKGGLYAMVRGRRSSLMVNSRTGAIKGIFDIKVTSADESETGAPTLYMMQGSFLLNPEERAVSCASDTDCEENKGCYRTLCVPKSVKGTYAPVETDKPTDLRRENAQWSYGRIASEVERSDNGLWARWLGVPYHVNESRPPRAVPKSAGPSPFGKGFDPANESKVWPPLLFPFETQAQIWDGAMDTELREVFFSYFLYGIANDAPSSGRSLGVSLYLNDEDCNDTGTPGGTFDECLREGFGQGNEGYIPCLDKNPFWGDNGHLASAESDYAGTCQQLMANVHAAGSALSMDDCVFEPSLAVAIYQRDNADDADYHDVYLCPGWEEVVLWGKRASTSKAQEAAFRNLCAYPSAPALAASGSPGVVPRALDHSGDYECQQSGGTGPKAYPPRGIPLLSLRDRGDAETKSPSGLIQECIANLKLSASAPRPEYPAWAWNPSLHRQYLETLYAEMECFNPNVFYPALREVHYSAMTYSGKVPDVDGQRLYLRLLQQWLEMHSFIATQGMEEYRLAATNSGGGSVPEDDEGGTGDQTKAAPLEELISTVEAGLALILDEATTVDDIALNATPGAINMPDYRRGDFVGTITKDHEQRSGIAPVLLETASNYLRLVEEYVRSASLDAYEEVRDGGLPDKLASARATGSRAIRLSTAVEAMSAKLMSTAGLNSMPCDQDSGNNICNGRECLGGFCADSGWRQRWRAAAKEYLEVRKGTIRTLSAKGNPLGISELDLPLFFGDLTGTNSRFFASSDYLIKEWATKAVEASASLLARAQDAWVARRNSLLQDVVNEKEQEARIYNIGLKYGSIIANNCGLPNSIPTTGVLA